MKVSFMTFVCPDWDLERILEFGADSAYDGVEIRVEKGHAHGITADLPEADRRAVRERFSAAGVEVAALAMTERLVPSDPDDAEAHRAGRERNLELAADLGADVARIFGGGGDRESFTDEVATEIAAALTEVGEFAAPLGVCPLVEAPHDIVDTAADARAVMERVETDNAGLLWNSPEITDREFDLVGEYIEHVHMREAVLDPEYEGIVDLVERLDSVGFDGYLSLEVFADGALAPGELAGVADRVQRYVEGE